MLLVLWQLFLFRVCGNTTPKIAGQLWEVSEQCLLWFCPATVQHWPCTPVLEVTQQKPEEPAQQSQLSAHLLCSYSSSNNPNKILHCSDLEKQLQQAHSIAFFPFGLWQTSACLNRCHQHLSTLCSAGFFYLLHLLLLKRTNQILQPECSPDGKRWLNVKPEQFPIQIPKSTFKCCLQHNWHYTVISMKSVSAVRIVLRGNAEQSCSLLGMCVQTCV